MDKSEKIGFKRDLVVIDVLTLTLILLVSVSSPTWLRAVFGLPFILFFPGYMLIAALFPRKEDLTGIERLALSFGLSIAIVPIIGLILNYAWSIKLTPILVSLSLVILVMSAIALDRRSVCPKPDRFTVSFFYRQHLPGLKWQETGRLDRLLYIVFVVSILGAIGTVAYVAATPKEGESSTEFYILGINGNAEDYPDELAVGEKGEVILDIVNHEDEMTSYRVEVWEGTEQLNVWLDGAELTELETGPLGQEEKWEKVIGFTVVEPTSSTMLGEPAVEGREILTVTGLDSFHVNDYIQIGSSDEETAEFAQIMFVASPNSEETIITIDKPLEYNHDEGEMVINYKQKVEFRLFKNEDTEPYSNLFLYVNVLPA